MAGSSLSKNEILARYLNTAYFGDGAYGADSAAQRYFGKNATELSLSEAAMLAGLIKAPSELDPSRNLEPAQQRAGVVLDAMVKSGAITRQQADTAKAQPAVLREASEIRLRAAIISSIPRQQTPNPRSRRRLKI